MTTPQDDSELNKLEQQIDAARTQAEGHGTIEPRDDQEVEYEPGDPVGFPDPDTTP